LVHAKVTKFASEVFLGVCSADNLLSYDIDFCIPGSTLASPDETVRAMLLASGALPNSTKYRYLAAYAAVSS
jgi:hypothetical protein